jgi:hypothetical protein
MSQVEDGGAPRSRPTLARAAAEGERRGGLRALGVAATRVAAPIIRARGGGVQTRLKAEWAAIVGDEWADRAWPTSLGRDGALKLRVEPAAALEVQHRAPLLLERVNLYFGRAVAARLVLVQGPLPLGRPARPAPPRPLRAEQSAALDMRLAGVADPGLREALARLGRMVLGERS